MHLAERSNVRLRAGLFSWLCVLALLLVVPGEALARYASIVIDARSGKVLREVNADTRNYPASLTKMMTLYLAFEALEKGRLRLDQGLLVSRRAARMPASKLGLRRGKTIKVEDAILALVTKSANDAAVVLAEKLGGGETRFARLMNRKAKELGMTRTSFRNASGLPNRRQLSTARDMATLAQALINDFPQHYKYLSTKSFRYRGRTYRNHNSLLTSYEGVDGLKTGYTRASGYNLAVSSLRKGRRLIAVVFGGKSAKSRDRHIAQLLDHGFATPMPLVAVLPAFKPRLRLVANETTSVPLPPSKPKVVRGTSGSVPGGAPAPPVKPKEIEIAPEKSGRTLSPIRQRQVAEAAEQLAENSRWGVQVGAFYNAGPARQAANAAARKFPKIFGETRIVIPNIQGSRGRIYRARLIGLSETQARRACKKLKAVRIDCLVVEWDDGVKLALRRTFRN